jgi:replicative DNA helicase
MSLLQACKGLERKLTKLTGTVRERTNTTEYVKYQADPFAYSLDVLKVTWWAKQQEIATALTTNRRVKVKASHGVGKALDLCTPIPTPDGWTTMGDLKVGDLVFNEMGEPVPVTWVSPIHMVDTYRVTFDDGSEIVASGDHLWQVIDLRRRPKTTRVTDWRDAWDQWTTTKSTREIAENLRFNGQLRWRVPTAKPVVGSKFQMPVSPYTFGAWLGDGTSNCSQFTAGDQDAEEMLANIRSVCSPAS